MQRGKDFRKAPCEKELIDEVVQEIGPKLALVRL